jgi:hypothetical protein
MPTLAAAKISREVFDEILQLLPDQHDLMGGHHAQDLAGGS